MSKSVRLSEEFHEYVKAHKRAGETMEDTLRRLIGGPHPVEVAGILSPETADAIEKGVELADEGVIQRVPAPAVMELSYGVERWGDVEELRTFENVMRMYPVVDLTREIADKAGALAARADEAAGGESGIDKVDPMVAAVADTLGEPVLTENVADFEALGVEVETY